MACQFALLAYFYWLISAQQYVECPSDSCFRILLQVSVTLYGVTSPVGYNSNLSSTISNIYTLSHPLDFMSPKPLLLAAVQLTLAKFVVFLSSGFQQRELELKVFFLLFGNTFDNKTWPQPEQNRQPSKAILGLWIMLMKISSKLTVPHSSGWNVLSLVNLTWNNCMSKPQRK